MEDKRDLYRGDRDPMNKLEIDQEIQATLDREYDRVNQKLEESRIEQEPLGYPDWGDYMGQSKAIDWEPNWGTPIAPDVERPVGGRIPFLPASERYLRYDLIPTDVLKEVVEVLTFGQEKHVQNAQGEGKSWTAGQLYSVRINKILRHLTSFIEGDIIDSESRRHALAHVIVQAMFLLGMDLTGQYRKFDDRSRLNGENRKPEEE